jgi:hypothetical protein
MQFVHIAKCFTIFTLIPIFGTGYESFPTFGNERTYVDKPHKQVYYGFITSYTT